MNLIELNNKIQSNPAEIIRILTGVKHPGHTIPVCDPVVSVCGKLSNSSMIVAHDGGSDGTRLSKIVMIRNGYKVQERRGVKCVQRVSRVYWF